MGERVPHREQEAIGVERLLEEVERSALRGFHRRRDRAVAGDHDDLRTLVELAQPAQRLEAVQARHLHVEEDEVRTELGVHRDRLPAGARHLDFEVFVFEDLFQGLADTRFVVDDQNPMAHGRGAP